MRNFFKGIKDFVVTPSPLRDALRAGLTMFVVGVSLAALAVPVAYGLGAAGLLESAFAADLVAKATLSSVAWTGVFFGMFGAIQAVAAPVVGKFFEPKRGSALLAQVTPGVPDFTQVMSHATAQNVSPTQFQDLLAKQAAASVNTPGQSVG